MTNNDEQGHDIYASVVEALSVGGPPSQERRLTKNASFAAVYGQQAASQQERPQRRNDRRGSVVAIDFAMIAARIAEALTWGKCPNCKQSATGSYAGRLGCARCGWPSPPRQVSASY